MSWPIRINKSNYADGKFVICDKTANKFLAIDISTGLYKLVNHPGYDSVIKFDNFSVASDLSIRNKVLEFAKSKNIILEPRLLKINYDIFDYKE